MSQDVGTLVRDSRRIQCIRPRAVLSAECLYVGHREIFSELSGVEWVRGFGKRIYELHLHDNLGAADDHMPIGEGVIDFDGLFEEVRALVIDPVYTLEAHSAEDAMVSLERVKRYL
ncbi:MAG: sugar phosphate isomerase/epimerase [Nitrospirae bacterium]|nr:sugar phosphate isomerase/epimerase [Nitrospirota bacterium]